MMTKSIKKQMYRNIAMLIFFLVMAAVATLASKAEAVDQSEDKAQEIKAAPGDSDNGTVRTPQ